MENKIEQFIEDIDFSTEENRDKILQWCNYIGYNRYYLLYLYLKNFYPNACVEDKVLIALAKYDFKIADILYSAIKFVELALRAKILNNFPDVEFSKDDYLYVISKNFTDNEKELKCTTYYDNKLNKNKCSLEDFINESGMDTLIKVFIALPNNLLKEVNENIDEIEKDLSKIKDIRNAIAHGRAIITLKYEGGLLDYVKTILNYIPSNGVRTRIMQEINEETKKLIANNINEKILKDKKIDLIDLS